MDGADGAFNSGDVRSIKVASLFSRCTQSGGTPSFFFGEEKKSRRRRRGEKVGEVQKSDGGGRKIEEA